MNVSRERHAQGGRFGKGEYNEGNNLDFRSKAFMTFLALLVLHMMFCCHTFRTHMQATVPQRYEHSMRFVRNTLNFSKLDVALLHKYIKRGIRIFLS